MCYALLILYVNGTLILGCVVSPLAPAGKETTAKKLKDMVSSVSPPEELKEAVMSFKNKSNSTVSITVVGASGDLAKKKIFPALFALYYEDCLPEVCLEILSFYF